MEFKVGDRVEIVDKQNYWLNDREKKGVVVSSDQFNVEVSIDGYVYGSLGFEPSSLSLVTGMEYNFDSLTPLIKLCADESKQWWIDLETGEPKDRNIGEVLCLIHSEISEAMEGYRKDLNDDKLPHRKMIEVELADAVIRIFDLAGQKGYDLAGAMKEKMEYNRHRADHKIENRKKANGKKF